MGHDKKIGELGTNLDDPGPRNEGGPEVICHKSRNAFTEEK